MPKNPLLLGILIASSLLQAPVTAEANPIARTAGQVALNCLVPAGKLVVTFKLSNHAMCSAAIYGAYESVQTIASGVSMATGIIAENTPDLCLAMRKKLLTAEGQCQDLEAQLDATTAPSGAGEKKALPEMNALEPVLEELSVAGLHLQTLRKTKSAKACASNAVKNGKVTGKKPDAMQTDIVKIESDLSACIRRAKDKAETLAVLISEQSAKTKISSVE